MSAPVESLAADWGGLAVAAVLFGGAVAGLLLDWWAAASRRRTAPRVYWHGRHGLADCVERSASRVTLLELPDGSTLEVRR